MTKRKHSVVLFTAHSLIVTKTLFVFVSPRYFLNDSKDLLTRNPLSKRSLSLDTVL